MGTSVNQRSPDTLNWRAAQATYEDAGIPIERVLQEIWRAATTQPDADFKAMLAEPIVLHLRNLALGSESASSVAASARKAIAESKQTSLMADIAFRAAVQAATAPDRAQAYSERVFAEASNYLISRDLPGYVGSVGRSSTIADSLQFKSSVLRAATDAVKQTGVPSTLTAGAWRKHTAAVIDKLRGQSR